MALHDILIDIQEMSAEALRQYLTDVKDGKEEITAQMMNSILKLLQQNDIKVQVGQGSKVDALVDQLDDDFGPDAGVIHGDFRREA